ncbi:LysE family transporter [Xanthomonas citri pv. citri]
MNYFDYFLFIFSVIIMIATPGPVMILVASAGLKGGYKKALETIFGTNLASLVLIFISVLVLKGVLGINENYLNIIRVLGCLYMVIWVLVFSKKSFKLLILKQFKPFLLKMAVLKKAF